MHIDHLFEAFSVLILFTFKLVLSTDASSSSALNAEVGHSSDLCVSAVVGAAPSFGPGFDAAANLRPSIN